MFAICMTLALIAFVLFLAGLDLRDVLKRIATALEESNRLAKREEAQKGD